MVGKNPHYGGVWLMSGTWKVHMNIIHHIKPHGLHREVYSMIPEKRNEFINGDFEVWDSCFVKIIYHYNRWI